MHLQALATNSNVTMDISVWTIRTTVMDIVTAMMGVMKKAAVSSSLCIGVHGPGPPISSVICVSN